MFENFKKYKIVKIKITILKKSKTKTVANTILLDLFINILYIKT